MKEQKISMDEKKILKAAVKGKFYSENLLLQANAMWKFGKCRLTTLKPPASMD